MAQVVGCIISIVIAGWFFVSARSIGRNGIGWAVIGFLAILVPSSAWSVCVSGLAISGSIPPDLDYRVAYILGLLLGIVGVGLGAGLAYWVHRKYLKPSTQQGAVAVAANKEE